MFRDALRLAQTIWKQTTLEEIALWVLMLFSRCLVIFCHHCGCIAETRDGGEGIDVNDPRQKGTTESLSITARDC